MPTDKSRQTNNLSSAYRRTRAMKGCRRVDVILSPQATRVLSALEESGLTATRAVCEGLVALGKQKGLG